MLTHLENCRDQGSGIRDQGSGIRDQGSGSLMEAFLQAPIKAVREEPARLVVQRAHKGFTLIELIVVIVILGVLAATAMPKFINMRRESRIAALNAMAGTLRTVMASTQAAYYAFPARRKSQIGGPYEEGTGLYARLALNDTTDVVVTTPVDGNWPRRVRPSGLPGPGYDGIGILLNCSLIPTPPSVPNLYPWYDCGGYTVLMQQSDYALADINSQVNIFAPGVTPTGEAINNNGGIPDTPKCFVNYATGGVFGMFSEPSVTVVTDDC